VYAEKTRTKTNRLERAPPAHHEHARRAQPTHQVLHGSAWRAYHGPALQSRRSAGCSTDGNRSISIKESINPTYTLFALSTRN